MSLFSKATRRKAFLKIALAGPSGSGKTKSALRLARGLTDGRIAFLDTENKSASLFANEQQVDDRTGAEYATEFDVCDVPPPYQAERFIEVITGAKSAGYEVLVIDSFSHVWEAVLAFKQNMDNAGGNSYTNWNAAGKKFSGVLDLIRSVDMHVIVCMRSKMEYVLEENDKGKKVPRKIGLAPVVRDGTEYEFSTMFEIDMQHIARDTKGRLQKVIGDEPLMLTESVGAKLRDWINEGEPPLPPPEVWTEGAMEAAKSLVALILQRGGTQSAIDSVRSARLPPSKTLEELQNILTTISQTNTTKENAK
jgi:DNA polymerase III delta prime subunit